jgi:hypothetical protein
LSPRPTTLAKVAVAAAAIAGTAYATLLTCTARARSPALRVEPLGSSTPAGARVPELSRLPDGALLLSWLEPRKGGGHTFRMAIRRAKIWSEPRSIASGDDILFFSASLPAVVATPGGALLAYWEARDRSGPDPYSEKIKMATSTDEGRTWSASTSPHRDNVPGQHGFVSAFPVGRAVGLVWLDAREQRYVSPPPGTVGKEAQWLGHVGLRYTTVDDAGRLGPDVTVDPVTCECCPTAAAVTSKGPIVAYRGRSDPPTGSGELRYDQDVIRDIQVARLQDGRWTSPKRVHADNWVFNGCPDNGPAVAAEGDGLAVAWWTAADGNPAVNVAFSKDAGDTFGPAIRVDAGFGQGQVTVALVAGGAVVGWLESGRTRARFVGFDGSRGPTTTLGSAAHHSRLPHWPVEGRGLIAAWTEGGDDDAERAVRLVKLTLD